MEPSRFVRLKICCIADRGEAALAVAAGAAAVGLVSAMPSGPGVLQESTIAHIAATVPPGVATFLLTSSQNVTEIVRQQQCCRVNTIQLCDDLPFEGYRQLRDELPGIAIVQVIHVEDDRSIRAAETAAGEGGADALLLDSGRPNATVKELGGTGRRHDWSISRRIRQLVPVPIYLAGGLNVENVSEAIETVRPFGLDVCTGLRTGGRLDPAKTAAMIREIHRVSQGDS